MKLSGWQWVAAAVVLLAAPIIAFKLGGAELAGIVSPAAGGLLLLIQKKEEDQK